MMFIKLLVFAFSQRDQERLKLGSSEDDGVAKLSPVDLLEKLKN
jgi:hypothetical protein